MKKILLLSVFVSCSIFAQKSAAGYIRAIENGKQDSIKTLVEQELKKKPKDADLLYVSALLTDDGAEAIKKYTKVTEAKKQSSYADAAWFKLYQYHYALGLYSKAQNCKDTLTKNFPKSKYIALLDNTKSEPAMKTAKMAPNPNAGKVYPSVIDAPVETTASSIIVQIGAFSKKENAKELMRKLDGKKVNITLSEKNVGGSVFYIVSAFGFGSDTDAKQFSEKINKQFSLQSRIISQ